MTREEAIKRIKSRYNKWALDDKDLEAIQYIFPDLKESEDERIRKELYSFISSVQHNYLCANNKREKWLAWLEKQKEQKPINNSTREKIISRATSEKQVVLVSESDGNAEIGWDTRSLKDTKKLLEYGIVFINKQLGVKSTEWSEEDEEMLECSDPFKRFVDMVHSVDKDEFTEFEWLMINFVLACCDKNIAMTPKGIHCYAKTILNIVKKEFSPKIYGWADEEETVIHNACEFIRHRLNDSACRNGSIGGMDYKVLYEKLKSLKNRGNSPKSNTNSPSWKPSEEQMEALMLAIEGKWEGIKPTGYMSRRLEDLYEGLANTFKVECKLEEKK